MDDLLARRPGRGRHRHGGEEGLVARGRLGVAIVEIVDQLLDPHRIARRQLAVVEEAADIGVGGGVDVDREGRHRRLGDALDRIDRRVGIFFGLDVAGLRQRRGGAAAKLSVGIGTVDGATIGLPGATVPASAERALDQAPAAVLVFHLLRREAQLRAGRGRRCAVDESPAGAAGAGRMSMNAVVRRKAEIRYAVFTYAEPRLTIGRSFSD